MQIQDCCSAVVHRVVMKYCKKPEEKGNLVDGKLSDGKICMRVVSFESSLKSIVSSYYMYYEKKWFCIVS